MSLRNSSVLEAEELGMLVFPSIPYTVHPYLHWPM